VVQGFLSASIEHEAGVKAWLKGLVSKIPGLPSKEQALKTVGEFLKKNSQKFDQIVKDINEHLDMLSTVELHNKYAFDMKGLMRSVRTLADPKVILAIIALMGMFQTADAGALRDIFLQPVMEQSSTRQERKQERREMHERKHKMREIQEDDWAEADKEGPLVIPPREFENLSQKENDDPWREPGLNRYGPKNAPGIGRYWKA
jgi:hypothetical protein